MGASHRRHTRGSAARAPLQIARLGVHSELTKKLGVVQAELLPKLFDDGHPTSALHFPKSTSTPFFMPLFRQCIGK